MKIIALDLSITGTGFCYISTDISEITITDNFGTGSDYGHHMERIGFIVDNVIPHMDQSCAVFVEDYAYGIKSGASRIAMLAELGGVVKYNIWRRTGQYPYLVNQSTIKKWLGHGGMDPKDMPKAVLDKYGLVFDTHDECVAYALADIGRNLLWMPHQYLGRELNSIEMEVMKTLRGKYKQKISLMEAELNNNTIIRRVT